MFRAAANSLFGNDDPPSSNRIQRLPPYMIPFNEGLQRELHQRGIVDRTAVLWEKHQKGEIDLNDPFCFGRDREILQISVLLSNLSSILNSLRARMLER